MPLDFSFFADDMILEILGYLPALDVVRYRRVCRRIFQASKERSVWINVFLRAQCPLPDLDPYTTSTQDVERLLVQMEIIDAKWSGVRPSAPQVVRKSMPNGHVPIRPFYGLMSPYVVEATQDGNATTYTWYQRNDLQNPVLEYQVSPRMFRSPLSYIEPGDNALYIAYIENLTESPIHDTVQHLKIAKFECSKENIVTKTLEHDIPLRTSVLGGTPTELSLQNGYMILFRYPALSKVVELFHLETGKAITCPVHSRYDNSNGPVRHFMTTSHFIQLFNSKLAFSKLPTAMELKDSVQPLRETHIGTLPRNFDRLHFFSRSASSFVALGIAYNYHRENFHENAFHIYLLTLNLDKRTPTCQIREDFVYEVKGTLQSLFLAPCSLSSRSALGILTVEASLPTHTPSGRRIARTFRTARTYHLAMRVDFGVEGQSAPSITLTEMDFLPGEEKETVIRSFNPYAGQVVLGVHEYPRAYSPVELVIVDYVSP